MENKDRWMQFTLKQRKRIKTTSKQGQDDCYGSLSSNAAASMSLSAKTNIACVVVVVIFSLFFLLLSFNECPF